MDIKVGEYWLVEGGSVFKVTDSPVENRHTYLGDRISHSGFITGVGVCEEDFEEKIDSQIAKKKALAIMEEKILDFLL